MKLKTKAPLPSWPSIFKVIFSRSLSCKQISELWTSNKNRGFLFSRSAWSLDFIAKYRLLVLQKDTLNIWIPSYFCNASLAPLRALKVNLIFYPMQESGNPDIEGINKMLSKDNRPDLILGVHYFGKIMDLKGLSEIAYSNGAWLIEDSAHVLRSNIDSDLSHFTLFSPHKFLPLYDGAILVINDKLIDEEISLESLEDFYRTYIDEPLSDSYKQYSWLIKRILQKIGINRYQRIENFQSDELIMSTKSIPGPKVTKLSMKLLYFLSNSLDVEEKKRHSNQKAWIHFLDVHNYEVSQIFEDSECVTPYMFGVIFKNKKEVMSSLEDFTNNKIPISTWPDLPPEVLQNKDIYGETIKLRLNSLFFPVHSSINEKDIKSFSTEYKRY